MFASLSNRGYFFPKWACFCPSRWLYNMQDLSLFISYRCACLKYNMINQLSCAYRQFLCTDLERACSEKWGRCYLNVYSWHNDFYQNASSNTSLLDMQLLTRYRLYQNNNTYECWWSLQHYARQRNNNLLH